MKSILKNTTLVVAMAATLGTANAAAPTAEDFVEPVAQYKLYVLGEIDKFVAGTKEFTEAVKSGNLEQAKALYGPVRVYYESTEPAAELFGDLDPAIDAREDDFKDTFNNPNWVGYHRIERILWHDNTTKGAEKYADELMANTLELQRRLKNEAIPVVTMVQGAADLMEEIAQTKITGEEDRYSRTDLYDFYGNLIGSKKIVDLISPLVIKTDPELLKKIVVNFIDTEALLMKYSTKGNGFQKYEAVTEDDKVQMKALVATLSEDLAKLRGTLGLDN